MLAAHVRSLTLLGIPFRSSTSQPFAFASQTITDEIRSLIPVMLRHRLTPPPQETYSLNRYVLVSFIYFDRIQLTFVQKTFGSFLTMREIRRRCRLPCYLGAGCWCIQSWLEMIEHCVIFSRPVIKPLENFVQSNLNRTSSCTRARGLRLWPIILV